MLELQDKHTKRNLPLPNATQKSVLYASLTEIEKEK